MVACTRDKQWYYYIIASLVTFFGGLLLIIPARILWYACYAKHASRDHERYQQKRGQGTRGCFARIRARLVQLVYGHNACSRFLVILFWLINMASVILYLVEATMYSIDDCGPFWGDPTQYTWLAFHCVFLLHYIIKVMASPDKLTVWVDIYSLVDHFTIPHIFIGMYLDKNWCGFRFLRIMYLLQAPEILEVLSVIKTRAHIRLIQIVSIFMACWLVSSGFVFLSENNGDPFNDYSNGRPLSYWMCVYWLLVTMSTVGYGEISPTTDVTRAFIVIFIIGSFAMFTSVIPELAKSLGRSSKYTKPYRRTYGKKHVVVSGNITYSNVCSFIRNFIHEDADSKNIDVVFLHSSKPKLELEAFFKRHFADVSFIQGSVMDLHSCQMVKMRDADAVLILADRRAECPDIEDAANITRATAVKNFHSKVRVIIQILQQKNKSYLFQIPNWDWKYDDVICVGELTLGILGQNCLAPGFATLISNLFTNRSYKGSSASGDGWERDYKRGCGHEIYVMDVSSHFVGMTFQQVTEICFAKMNVLILGVSSQTKGKLQLNPDTSFRFRAGDRAYMFAQCPEDARKVANYRPKKSDSLDCKVSLNNNNNSAAIAVNGRTLDDSDGEIEYLPEIGYRLANYNDENSNFTLERSPPPGAAVSETDAEQFDFSGLYHWCPTRTLEDATMDQQSITARAFTDHVVLCVPADASSPKLGLLNFVLPLRGSNLRRSELKEIVIVSSAEYMENEWPALANFPGIWVFPGHSSRSQLRLAAVPQCSVCVVISALGSVEVDGHVVDKDSVLTTLNVRNVCWEEDIELKVKDLGMVVNDGDLQRHVSQSTREVQYITELANDSDVTFIEQDDVDDPDVPMYLTPPYVSGRLFAESVLDSLASCTYLSKDVLTLTRALINGVDCSELELMLAEGLGFVHRSSRQDPPRRNRSHVAQYALNEAPLNQLATDRRKPSQPLRCYGELFIEALRTHGFLSMGIYRLMDIDPKDKHLGQRKRYVITHPPFNSQLLSTDKVFVLKPFTYQPQPPATKESTPGDQTSRPRSRNGSTRSSTRSVSSHTSLNLDTQL